MPEEIVNALTIDVEESSQGHERETALGAEGLYRVPARLARLLDVLDAHRARGTFFTLGVVARRHPRLVREIIGRGHEIASHGWDNTPVYQLGPAGFRADVRRAKQAVEHAAGRFVRGYRAPSHSIRRDTPWAFTVLAEEGFVYDSSLCPVAHDRGRVPVTPRFPHVARTVDGIDFWEIPVGTARFVGVTLPLGGPLLDFVPAALVRRAIARVNARERRPIVYVQSWAVNSRPPRTVVRRLRRGREFNTAEVKLSALLAAGSFGSIEAVFEEVRLGRRIVSRAS